MNFQVIGAFNIQPNRSAATPSRPPFPMVALTVIFRRWNCFTWARS